MSLWKRGNVWWAYFYIDGVRHQASTGTGNRRRAEQIAQKLKEDANLARHDIRQIDPDLTFGALAARFIANASPTAYHLDRLKILLPYFADLPVVRITKATAREYRTSRHEAKTLKDATINRDLSVLRHILYWGVDEGLVHTNPLTRLRLPRERPTARSVVTVAEEQKLLTAAPPHLQALIIAALDTGMRRGELLNQRWEHVDLTRSTLLVTRSKTIEGEKREIPLTGRVADLLQKCQIDSGLVFTYHDNGIRRIKTTWRTTLRKAGVRHIRFHDLRHTFNTRQLEAGVLQEVRKALMGHVSGGGINAQYTHIELPLKREAIAKLECWHAAQTKTQADNSRRNDDDRSTIRFGENRPDPIPDGRPQALEEEDAGRSRHGSGEEAARTDRGAGGRAQGSTPPTAEVRGGPEDL